MPSPCPPPRRLTGSALTEEIEHLRWWCGYSDAHIATTLHVPLLTIRRRRVTDLAAARNRTVLI